MRFDELSIGISSMLVVPINVFFHMGEGGAIVEHAYKEDPFVEVNT